MWSWDPCSLFSLLSKQQWPAVHLDKYSRWRVETVLQRRSHFLKRRDSRYDWRSNGHQWQNRRQVYLQRRSISHKYRSSLGDRTQMRLATKDYCKTKERRWLVEGDCPRGETWKWETSHGARQTALVDRNRVSHLQASIPKVKNGAGKVRFGRGESKTLEVALPCKGRAEWNKNVLRRNNSADGLNY